MEKISLEKQGRILIPKKVRSKLRWRPGEELALIVEKNEVILRPFKSKSAFSSELKGCVSESKINPLDLKNLWES